MNKLFYPIGLLIALVAFSLSANHLHQSLSSYYDFVALMMVIGGTIAVSVITLPLEHLKDIVRGFKMAFYPNSHNSRNLLQTALKLVAARRINEAQELPVAGLPAQILKEGFELLELGIDKSRLEQIMTERIFQGVKRLRRVGNSVKNLAKYPPAFGLMGTVLGLVNLMRQISAGMDAKQTGVEMAVALVATLYGLIVSNLVIYPAAEAILKHVHDESDAAEIALQTVMLAADQASLLEAQEMLNSHVADESRFDILTMSGDGEAVA